jgi:thiamine-phosphate pyrophosphorylase
VSDRLERLSRAHLYLVCDAHPDAYLQAALRGGVDIIQLRMKDSREQQIVATARRVRSACTAHGALFILNDRPDLVERTEADGVHVGQDDMPVARARELVGPGRIVGLSTHTPEQINAAADGACDYIGVGPVYETPTKPGRPAVGVGLVRYAASHTELPFFAIGGVALSNVDSIHDAGAIRVAVVRALTEASDPALVARKLRAAIVGDRAEGQVRVGAA